MIPLIFPSFDFDAFLMGKGVKDSEFYKHINKPQYTNDKHTQPTQHTHNAKNERKYVRITRYLFIIHYS